MIGDIASGLAIWDWMAKVYKNIRSKHIESTPETVASRFIRLFETHGVHRNQIPRFFGHGLTVNVVKDDESLLPHLSEVVLDAACEKFAVRREWLDGASTQVHPYHDFYKQPNVFLSFVEQISSDNPDAQLEGVLIAPIESDFRAHAIILLQETIGYIGDNAICRYHICNNWAFKYWKARAYLTACVATAWKRRVYIHGIYQPKELIDQLAYGETLLGWEGKDIWVFGHKDWDPEYMAYDPDAFLDRVDPEMDEYGIINGLTLWLQLEREGYMESDFQNARAKFESKLAEYRTVSLT